MGATVAKADTKAEHARLREPGRELFFARGIVERHFAHNGEAVRVKARSFEDVIVAVSFPRGRYENRSINFGSCHFLQQLLAC